MVVQTPLPVVTLIDLILGLVILIMLLALSVRAVIHFFHRGGLRVRSRESEVGSKQ